MAMAQLTLVFDVAKKIKSLCGTLMYETPSMSKIGLSLYYLVATTCEQ